ncbi:glycerophosphocholine cholinephosphodiesterase ENPP6-like [Uloborus diversus]|uniref:glycerophosphocholine cholinephosphodiesterase ENPP6-like n=1 Tax=Uloborus diversus TaxID=327109 RepID=UPI0024099540|nr:glycerophosphocholine cholinephosphodiesterase ENPP6-like [Uloborus diversus]
MRILLLMCFGIAWGYPSFPTETEKAIVVLVDGVRWDYLNDSSYAGFKRIADNGVKAEYVTPVFPSNSYPNWYTIVTGLYPESHGIVQNYMYDTKKDDLFLMALHSNASHAHWWNDAEPVWVTAEKRDLKTAVYWWDGCQVVIHGKKPTKCEEYANYWVWGKVNLIVVSDHGMTSVDSSKVIDIEKAADIKDIRLMLDRGAVSMLLPERGREDKVYQDLKKANVEGLTVYKKSDIPEHYHFKRHKLVQPLLLVADKGYVIKALSDPRRMKPFAERIFKGYHGYDPYKVKDMRTIFYARGPLPLMVDDLQNHLLANEFNVSSMLFTALWLSFKAVAVWLSLCYGPFIG